MQKPISAADTAPVSGPGIIPVHFVVLTLDTHMASALERAAATLAREMPGLRLKLHAMTTVAGSADAAEACRRDIEKADFLIANMLFMEDHLKLVMPWINARRETCDCVVGCLSAAEAVKTTRLGEFSMSKPTGGAIGFLKRLRGKSGSGHSAGRNQMKLLRSIPKLLKYIPGKAQDVRAYFLVLQYLLAGSDDNIANLVRFLISRYAKGPREVLRRTVRPADPVIYPDTGLYHPRLKERVSENREDFLKKTSRPGASGTVGVLIMRSYVLADNTAHYDGVIAALEARGLTVIPAFASGLDARPAIEAFFMRDGKPAVDCLLSLTGFSLVGGPAYNDAQAAEDILARLDVPYLSAFASEFQSMQQWARSDQGLTPVETTIMVALPEIDGGTRPMLYGGRSDGTGNCTGCARGCSFADPSSGRDMMACHERAVTLAGRTEQLIALRRRRKAERKIGIVLYNFPPNSGATGTAAYLDVFTSLHNTLKRLAKDGYTVEVPETVEALRTLVLEGSAARTGMAANTAATISTEDHITRQNWLGEIEAQWGAAPGRHQTDGRAIHVLGRQFGNVLVAIQPSFGYEGDPMRLLFERGFAPTHAFAAFYRYLADDFGADALLHFGTHGALEFMPGKQTGLSGDCWPERLIGTMPNFYLYAANNPSEGIIARRRSMASLISHLTPPVGQAGLYRGLVDLKHALDRWRALTPAEAHEREGLIDLIRTQAAALDLVAEDADFSDPDTRVPALASEVLDFETALIPHGLHIVGGTIAADARLSMLLSVNEALGDARLEDNQVRAIAEGRGLATKPHDEREADARATLAALNDNLQGDHELPAILHALDGGYTAPVSGGDIVRSPGIVPTGRNIHGFDPFRLPSAFAVKDGREQAEKLIARYAADNGRLPERIAMVLWGTDNLKSEGGPIAQALWLMGAKPRFDSFGRLSGADLVSLEELGRPRIDVVITLSGIFRDLLPIQTKVLAEAALKAALAEDEPEALNPIRAQALRSIAETGVSLETAALRVFSNASGTYGANVNLLIDSGAWDEPDELADTYMRRKSFAYGVNGEPVQEEKLLKSVLARVDTAYQNIESVELGVTTIDHYFDTLGGVSRAIRQAGGGDVTVYVGDQTTGQGKVRSLTEQVALETRTRALNPKWYEAMLSHGYEGVRQIEAQVTNVLGWSATTGQVQPWVYRTLTETFMLDPAMRARLAELNPKASAKLVNRLIEASDRKYWTPDPETLAALMAAGEEMEDRMEGLSLEAAE